MVDVKLQFSGIEIASGKQNPASKYKDGVSNLCCSVTRLSCSLWANMKEQLPKRLSSLA